MTTTPWRQAIATAPVRVADVGGWTDTWFGSPGQVCHLAVGPGVRVQAALVPLPRRGRRAASGSRNSQPAEGWTERQASGHRVRLRTPGLGEDYGWDPWATGGPMVSLPGRHPLLEHAITSVLDTTGLAEGEGLDLEIISAVPPGASTGTSASVVVALLATLDALLTGTARAPAALAVAAHEVETVRAGRESGVQDQWAAAFGGAARLSIGPYPEVRRREIDLPVGAAQELGERLVTVVFGSHDSSAVHAEVIDAVVGCGGAAHDRARQALGALSALAGEAAEALGGGDLDGWAGLLTQATEVQRRLHPALIGPAHEAAIDRARSLGAAGWKVNGAGGEGGSLTVAAVDADQAAALASALDQPTDGWLVVPLAPAPGVQVEVLGES